MSDYKQPILIMETDVSAVTAGGTKAGWVSGTPANLALSAGVTVLFDLGPDWDQYLRINVMISPIGPSTGFANVAVSGSSTTTINNARRLNYANSSGTSTMFVGSITTAASTQGSLLNPAGRYVHVSLTNADATNAMGATSKVTLAAYPS